MSFSLKITVTARLMAPINGQYCFKVSDEMNTDTTKFMTNQWYDLCLKCWYRFINQGKKAYVLFFRIYS